MIKEKDKDEYTYGYKIVLAKEKGYKKNYNYLRIMPIVLKLKIPKKDNIIIKHEDSKNCRTKIATPVASYVITYEISPGGYKHGIALLDITNSKEFTGLSGIFDPGDGAIFNTSYFIPYLYNEFLNILDPKDIVTYKIGKTINVENFYYNKSIICASGIHFFETIVDVIRYFLVINNRFRYEVNYIGNKLLISNKYFMNSIALNNDYDINGRERYSFMNGIDLKNAFL